MQHRSTCIVESCGEIGTGLCGHMTLGVGKGSSFSVFWPVCLEPKIKFYAKMHRARFSFFAWGNSQACMFCPFFKTINRVLKQSGSWPIQPVYSLGFSFALLKKQHRSFTSLPTQAVPGSQIVGMTRKRKARENVSSKFRFLGNYPRTPPLSHRFALTEK